MTRAGPRATPPSLVRMRTLTVLLVLSACPRRPAPIEEAVPGGTEVFDEPADGDEADRRAIEAAVLESYLDLSSGNDEAYAEALSRDLDVTVIGVGPDDVAFGTGLSADQVPTLPFRDVEPCTGPSRSLERPLVLSRDLEVVLHGKEGERSVAWVSDEISYRIPWHCRQAIVPLRLTALFVRNLERWDEVLLHVSYGIAGDELRELAASRALETPRAIERAFSVGPSVKVRGVVATSLAADEQPRQLVIDDAVGSIAILPGAHDVFRDQAARSAPWIVSAIGDVGHAELDGYRISVSTDQLVAWVAANVRVTSRVGDTPVTVLMRGTFVLERSGPRGGEPAGWRVVQRHISVPVARADLGFRVFGEEAGGR